MMVETTHAPRALQAALETGLPVWLGVGCRKTEDGKIVSFDHADLELAAVLDALIPEGPAVVNIMHSEIGAISQAIELVRQRWSGPIGVYPESGYFTQPHWNFVDVIPPADLVTEALGWVAAGVRLLGGCCGTSPDHVKALQAAMPELEASFPLETGSLQPHLRNPAVQLIDIDTDTATYHDENPLRICEAFRLFVYQ
jgi:homocysteine S-methyltransferase